MKKIHLLLLLTLPLCAGAETWADFVARADAALAAVGQDEAVVIEADEVDCYRYVANPENGSIRPLDPGLSVPWLNRLTIKGGSFAGMLVGRGEGVLELDGVTVRSADEKRPAIQLMDDGEASFMLLEVGADTLVEATGAQAPAIGNITQPAWTYPDREMAVMITNYGTLRSADTVDGGAVALHYGNSGQGSVVLMVTNHGQMQAPVRLDAYSRGGAVVELVNEEDGVITGPEFYIWLEAYSQSATAGTALYNKGALRALEPRRGGPGEPSGHIYLAANWSDYGLGDHGPEAAGEIFYSNPGEMTEAVQLALWTPLTPETHLIWQDGDQGKNVPGSVMLNLERDITAGQPGDAALLGEVKDWLDVRQHRFPGLPADTPLSIRMVLSGGEDGWAYYPEQPWTESWADWGLPAAD